MNLKKELSDISLDKTKYSRADFRNSLDFFAKYPSVSIVWGLVMIGGGIASVLGYLKAQEPILQWALALFLWSMAGVAFFYATRGKRNSVER